MRIADSMEQQIQNTERQAETAWRIAEEKANTVNAAWDVLGGDMGKYKGLTLGQAIQAALKEAKEAGKQQALDEKGIHKLHA